MTKPTPAQRRVLEILRDEGARTREQIRARLYYGAIGGGHVVTMTRRLLSLGLVLKHGPTLAIAPFLFEITEAGRAALAEGSEQLPVKKRRGK